MLTVDECRKLLPEGADLPDEELRALIAQLYSLAHVAVDAVLDGDRTRGARRPASVLDLVPPEDKEAVEERASIREFEGGQPRADAERGAVLDFLRVSEAKP